MSTSNAEKNLEVGMLIRLGGLLSGMAVLFLTDELVGSAGTIPMDASVVSVGKTAPSTPVFPFILDLTTIPTNKLDLRFLSNTATQSIKSN